MSANARDAPHRSRDPRFSWQGGLDQTFALVLSTVTARGQQAFVRIERDGYQLTGSSHATSLRGVVSFVVTAAGDGTVQLTEPLSPGTYAWRVVAIAPDGTSLASARRRFPVNGPRLTTLNVSAARSFRCALRA